MTYNLRSARGRDALPPRADPYWEALGEGLSLGLYVGGRGQAWKARKPDATGGKRWQKATLGPVSRLSYGEAVRAAQE